MTAYSLNSANGIVRASDGAHVPADPANRDYQDYLAWVAANNSPTPYSPPAPTAADVRAERDRRLALGFDYDFGDARGVHHIGTTPSDLAGWDEVTKLAQASITAGMSTTITIVTDTGVAQVTDEEWQRVILASAAHRQPIWAASFVLAAMPVIPADFRDDKYWSA